MKRIKKGKRLLAVALSMLLAFGGLPTSALAEGLPVQATQGLCEHHQEHTDECGYGEGQPCEHEHSEDCYTDELICGYDEEAETTASDSEAEHTHTQECYAQDCPHERGNHDDACGYGEAQPCGYTCELCGKTDNEPEPKPGEEAEKTACLLTEGCTLPTGHEGECVTEPGEGEKETACTLTEGCTLPTGHEGECVTEPGEGEKKTACTLTEGCTLPAGHEGACVTELPPVDGAFVKTIMSWTFEDNDYLSEGVLALPGVSADNQISFDDLVSMLPTKISAEIDGETDPVPVAIAGWSCAEYVQDNKNNWPVTGEYVFTAELDAGYACNPLPEVKVQLGGAELYTGGPVGAFTVTGDASKYEWADPVLTIRSGATLTIQNTDPEMSTLHRIKVEPRATDVNLTLAGVNIDLSGSGNACAFDMTDAVVTLTLAENTNNILISGSNRAGLEAPAGATLTIGGSGSLKATGGGDGAGIGGAGSATGNGETAGTVNITGGQVTVGATNGAGIGGGYGLTTGGTGGTVDISGGRVTVDAAGSAGIGGGFGGTTGGAGGTVNISGADTEVNITITGRSAGIGGGGSNGNGGAGGDVNITGGQVTVGAVNGAGIGGGFGGTTGSAGGTVNISGADTEVNITVTGRSAGIGGGGSNGNGGAGGDVSITGGKLTIHAAEGAGIGGGFGGTTGGASGIVEISGADTAVEITLTDDGWGAGIGGGGSNGDGGAGGDVNITGATVTVGATNGAGIGGGFGGTTGGAGGSLSVTGEATLEMQKNGTNAQTTYQNCTIIDNNGNSVEYGNSGRPLASPTLSLSVAPAGSLALPGNITLTATLSGANNGLSGKTVTFTVNGGQPVPVATDTSGVATHTITSPSPETYNFGASFAGDGDNKPASAAGISGYTVSRGTQESLTLNGLRNTYTYGDDTFRLSTSGGSGDGAVSYQSSDTSVASVTNDQVTILKAGTFTITATKAEDDNYAEAKVTSGTVTVNPATPGISLTAIGGADINDPIVLTATVSKAGTGTTPTGTVTFSEGDKILAENVILNGSGEATCTVSNLTGGNHTYTVTYSGQSGYYNPASADRTVGVGLANQTGFTVNDPGAKTYGDNEFTLTAAGGQSSGGVSFSVPDGNGVLTVAADGKVSITGAGKVTVTATKAGDNKYNQATATQEITVKPRDIDNVTVNVTGSRVYAGSQLQPDFAVSDSGIAINTGDYINEYGSNVDTGTGAGSIKLIGQRNYTGTKTVAFDIEKRPLDGAAITLEAASYTHTGGEIKPAVTKVVVDGVIVPASAFDVGYANNTAVGTATVTITAKADGNFSGTASTTFEITKSNSSSGGGGGSSSSGNSGSNIIAEPSKPVETQPNAPTTGVIEPEIKVEKDGTVKVEVSDKDIQNAIDNALAQARKDGTQGNGIAVAIDMTGLQTQFNTLPLTLSKTAYDKLVKAGVKSLDIRTPQISLSLDLATLKTIHASATGNVTINAAKADVAMLPGELSTRPAYNLTITSGGNTISQFGGYVALTLPYALQAGEQGGNLQMAYVGADGKLYTITDSSYDADTKALIGRTNHFTVFGIANRPAPAFSDIENHWAKDDIRFVASRGLLTGTGNQQFSPDTGMTRGMFVTALGRLAGVNPDSYQSRSFTDVKADAYYAAYVEWAAQKNIVKGTGDKLFSPDAPVTREQMAVMMVNYAGQMGYSIPTPLAAATFADNGTISTWAAKEVAAMQRAGIIKGKDGNRFDPQASATRAEVSAVLRRFVEIVIDPATASGWEKNDSGHWLYYKSGKALTGWQTIGKLRYFFNADGVMHEGWKQDTDTNKWYYWTDAGAVTGWREIDGKWYYFNENGVMAVNTKIDGYEVGPDGARKKDL